MLRGLWKLTWLELKIFVREPLGFIGSIGIPVAAYILVGRAIGPPDNAGASRFVSVELPVFAAILIALSAALSLVTIIAIYREGGILKRLRATPLRPHTILTAHVLVKLFLTAVTLALMMLAGRRYYPVEVHAPLVSFAVALLFTTLSIACMGFVIASLVPTARFAQPIGSLILYPMIGLSGLFVPIANLPAAVRPVAKAVPLTYAVSLLRGVWEGHAWTTHIGDVLALLLTCAICLAISAKVFRWE
jgi:ABC-2 type transport system permease protein